MPNSVVVAALALATIASAQECTFRRNPEAFLDRQAAAARNVFERTRRLGPITTPKSEAMPLASTLAPRNMIDEEIFGALATAGVPSAAISTDEEFLRRVTLDLAGRLPTPAEVRSFTASDSATKRDDWIESLIGSPAFVDKWTMWWGDLFENCQYPALFDRRVDGRNAYYNYIKSFVKSNKTLRDVQYELLTASGNHYDLGTVNFPITALTNMGPRQDAYDNGLVKTATYFLGMAQYDCLLCHNGRGHLDQINLWGSHVARMEAWQMAAHFAHLNIAGRNVPASSFYVNSLDVSENKTGTYDLNTTTGNRPARTPVGTTKNLTPVYRGTGAVPPDADWRAALARSLYKDPMFATNFVNRFWREFMGMGLVEPYDMLDPDRLDPDNPPSDPWTLQATHPRLLKRLADAFADSDFDVQGLMRMIVQSNAYQMSSRYDGQWSLAMVPLFARHYPRRLWAEEMHDVIVNGTGVYGNYTLTRLPSVKLAIQLPDPSEPNNDFTANNFMNYFLRGNRDSQPRSSALSIQQRMAMMNDPFVGNRVKAASANLAALFKITDNPQVTEEIYLTFLGRRPTDAEQQAAQKLLSTAANATDRNTYLEDLVWAVINKAEFQFSY